MKPRPQILVAPGTDPCGAEFKDPSVTLSSCYVQTLLAAGVLPWILPGPVDAATLRQAVRQADGVLLSGGNDVQTKLYRRRTPAPLKESCSPFDPKRDVNEFALIDEVFRQRKPLLAICRGTQILNVALGGSLIVDIAREVPGALNHQRMDLKDRVAHKVTLTPDSLLSKMSGRRVLSVNSTHHQAVGRVAETLQVTGTSPDGVVEALELAPDHKQALPFLVAVQFHPERLAGRRPEMMNLFRTFGRTCGSKRGLPV